MNNLKCLKQGFNKYVCKHTNQVIELSKCKNCPYKEYKEQKCTKSLKNSAKQEKKTLKIAKTVQKTSKNSRKLQSSAKMKQKSSKLAKLERERFSLFTDDLEHCIICGKSPVNKHEIFGGSANRKKSMEYGLVIPLCTCEHHDQVNCRGIHFDKKLRDEWHIKGQAMFTKTYPNLNFKDIFGRNYIK